MQESEKIYTLAGVLFVITAVVALLLASVNQLTAGKIEENSQKEQAEARAAVLQSAETFEEINYEPGEGSPVKQVFKGIAGETVTGYCVNVSPNGFGGGIEMMVGITEEGRVEAVKIVSLSETPGLGSKAQDDAFISQYNGKSIEKPIDVIKSGVAKENEIVAIAGATVTSKAVTSGVNAAVAAVNTIMAGGSV